MSLYVFFFVRILKHDFICKNSIMFITVLCNSCLNESLPPTLSSAPSGCSRQSSTRTGKRVLSQHCCWEKTSPRSQMAIGWEILGALVEPCVHLIWVPLLDLPKQNSNTCGLSHIAYAPQVPTGKMRPGSLNRPQMTSPAPRLA